MMHAIVAVCTLLALTTIGQTPPKPKPPTDDWRNTNFVTALSASITASGDPFDPSVHGVMTPQGEVCSNELNAAIYRQDVGHAFESRAHFDNCAFEESANYIDAFLDKARRQIESIPPDADPSDMPAEVLAAMLAFGQALHGIQDFYAHSNYVELMQALSPNLANETELPIVEVWSPSGRAELLRLTTDGLYSGRVWWSLPHRCDAKVPTHAALAKDGPNTPAGKEHSNFRHALTGKQVSNHLVAYNLASRATRELLRWAGQTYPQLEKFCGPTLRFNVQPDRRADD